MLTNLSVHDPDDAAGPSHPHRRSAHRLAEIRCDAGARNVEFELATTRADGKTCLAAPRTGERGERLRSNRRAARRVHVRRAAAEAGRLLHRRDRPRHERRRRCWRGGMARRGSTSAERR